MKTVIISGGTEGLGRELVKLFLHRGWHVATFSRSEEKAAALIQDFAGERLSVDVQDVANHQIHKLIDRIVMRFGAIDAVINNAGIYYRCAGDAFSDARVQELLMTNVYGIYNLNRAVIPYMKNQESGCIIHVASISAKEYHPLLSFYASSKAAVHAYSACLEQELRPYGIRVHCVYPPLFNPSFVGLTASAEVQKSLSEVAEEIVSLAEE